MDYYIDIRIIPDVEMRKNVLLNKVYSELHKALCDLKACDIGVSFPEWQVLLGCVIRIHSSKSRLDQLQSMNWVEPLSGYCQVSEVRKIPPDVSFRIISRKQSTMSPAKLRRLIRRGSITEDEIKKYRAKMFSKGLDNPYLELESGSNGHRHRRYIEFGSLLGKPRQGMFDQFGLSNTATVPWF